MTEIYFVNYFQLKNRKHHYKIKKLLYKSIGKCQIKTPKRALGSSLRFLAVHVRWEWIILAAWIAHLAHFITMLTMNLPLPPPYTRQYAFSWATCTLSNRTEPAITYMFKVNNRNIRTRCEMYSKLTINILLTLNIFHTLF